MSIFVNQLLYPHKISYHENNDQGINGDVVNTVFAARHRNRTAKAVTGAVLSDDGTPMPGVSIRIKGTTRFAQSNPSGQFTIQAAEGESLEFSFIGYQTRKSP